MVPRLVQSLLLASLLVCTAVGEDPGAAKAARLDPESATLGVALCRADGPVTLQIQVNRWDRKDFEVEAPTKSGAFAACVDPRGAAWQAGLRPMDFVTHIDGGEVDPAQPTALVAALEPGKRIAIAVRRPNPRGERISWRRMVFKAEPQSLAAFLAAAVPGSRSVGGVGTVYRFADDPATLQDRRTGLRVEGFEGDGAVVAVLCPTYYGSEWLFYDSVSIVTEKSRLKIDFPLSDATHDNTHNRMWECGRAAGGPDTVAHVACELLAAGLGQSVVYHGQDYAHEQPITIDEKWRASLVMQRIALRRQELSKD